MIKEEKIQELLTNNRCFSLSETDKYEYYICKGISGKVYDIIHFKVTDSWKCDCGNIRNNPCYHIEAIKRMKTTRS